ncbi:menaquinone biosynthesis protein [Vicingaceae bacterium]|nr:menaquinone biosynthesis protein [Vicingaceae bacterium]MDC1451699.1 menaquinone biosynthesis protein [Vicingaceae bacterium]
MGKVKISIVSYLNTTPLVFGIENNKSFLEQIELHKDIPSECARKLITGEVDLGLVPVAAIPSLKEAHVISEYCIGALGKVKSVLLVSDVPLEEIEGIYLDYHSRTSVNLCKVLCRELWNIAPTFIAGEAGFENKISGSTAGVIIGDRTFHLKKDYSHQFDLAEEWQKLTNLPFVFAAWVSNKKLTTEFIAEFNEVMQEGLNQLDASIETSTQNIISKELLKEYLTTYIDFDFDVQKHEAMNLFLSKK